MKGPKIALHRDKQSLCLFLQLFSVQTLSLLSFTNMGSYCAHQSAALTGPAIAFHLAIRLAAFHICSRRSVPSSLSYTMIYHCSFNYFLAVDIIFALYNATYCKQCCMSVIDLWMCSLRTNLYNLKYRFKMSKHCIA